MGVKEENLESKPVKVGFLYIEVVKVCSLRLIFMSRYGIECTSNLIYKYTCECCQAFYIGKTESQYKCRISQHLGVSARTGNELAVKVASDVRDHCFKCKVHVKGENFTIILIVSRGFSGPS